MAQNNFGNTPPNAGNDAPADEEYGASGGQPVPCVHIYAMADGTFGLKRAEEAPPEGLETAGDLQTAMAKAAEMLSAPAGGEEDAMAAAQAGYAKGPKRPPMAAPNPGGLFGE